MDLQSIRRKPIAGALAVLASLTLLVSSACHQAEKPAPARTVQELLRDLKSANDDQVRAAAARELGKSRDQSAAQPLIAALKDDSSLVRLAAAGALANFSGSEVTDSLAKALTDTDPDTQQDPAFQLAAASSLVQLNDARGADTLVRLLPIQSAKASAELQELGPLAVPTLVGALRGLNKDSASRLLISMGGGTDGLISLLRSQESHSTVIVAVRTLAEFDVPRAVDALNAAAREFGLEITAAGYRSFIRQGRPGSEAQLIQALKVYGTPQMAEDFVASKNPQLKSAAEDWASARAISVSVRSSDDPEVHWAGTDPSVTRLALYHFDGSLNSTSGMAPAESASVSFVPGKWQSALSVNKGGHLNYPLAHNIDFANGTIEMWVSPLFAGDDAIYRKYNHALLLYQSPGGDQFVFSEGTFGGFYAGWVVNHQYTGAGGGTVAHWKKGSWHHLAFTYSTTPLRQQFYVDGVMVAKSSAVIPTLDAQGKTFTIDCDPYGNWTGFAVDEVQISRGEKTADAIRSSSMSESPFPDR